MTKHGFTMKAQSSQWNNRNSPRPKKARQSRSCRLFSLITRKWIPSTRSNTQSFSLSWSFSKEIWTSAQWWMGVDPPQCSDSFATCYCTKNDNSSSPTSVLARSDPYRLFLFPEFKSPLKGRTCHTTEVIKQKSLEELNFGWFIFYMISTVEGVWLGRTSALRGPIFPNKFVKHQSRNFVFSACNFIWNLKNYHGMGRIRKTCKKILFFPLISWKHPVIKSVIIKKPSGVP